MNCFLILHESIIRICDIPECPVCTKPLRKIVNFYILRRKERVERSSIVCSRCSAEDHIPFVVVR